MSVKHNASEIHSCDAMLEDAKRKLKDIWGIHVSTFNVDLNVPSIQVKIEEMPKAVLISESWNKTLAFRSEFAEALAGRWRVLVAAETVKKKWLEKKAHFEKRFWIKKTLSRKSTRNKVDLEDKVVRMIENNSDPLAEKIGERILSIELLLVSMIDVAVRSLFPHEQVVQREAYRAIQGSNDDDPAISGLFYHKNECVTFNDYVHLFAGYALKPSHWLLFCEAFLWTMKTHVPYAQEDERDDLLKPNQKSAHAQFIAGMIALPMIEAFAKSTFHLTKPAFNNLKALITKEKVEDKVEEIVTIAFRKLCTTVPGFQDHLSQRDIEEFNAYLSDLVFGIVECPSDITEPGTELRETFQRISTKWNDLEIWEDSLMVLGKEIVAGVCTFLLDSDSILVEAFTYIWKLSMKIGIMYPITIKRQLILEAERFYNDVAIELKWSYERKRARLFEVKTEISAMGTYAHTPEELELGARLAWRNSAKCIGRISWNSLQVRDCRHVTNASQIFNEIVEHLKIATGGTNIQSVMTVFRPQRDDEIFGMRFWSPQVVRYAGYVNEKNGSVLGDPANSELTSYLIERELWTPPKPEERTAFDVLPVVLKIPNNEQPFVYELPREVIFQVDVEHPKYPELKGLGLKWTTIPAICNFSMKMGGIKYACIPFNGWFMSTEVVRNLLERYDMTLDLATVFGVDHNEKMMKEEVATKLESAILYSFENGGFTIVDPTTAGKSFMTHCKKERQAGRECPGQWSWIGGLVGPTNPTWHLEMRDFKKSPQFDYTCKPFMVMDLKNYASEDPLAEVPRVNKLVKKRNIDVSIPRIVIAFGSETGTADSAANALAKRLQMCEPKVCTLNELAACTEEYLLTVNYNLLLCSTFGQGEPPNNAIEFFNSSLNMKGTKFAVLALGSSLYPDYCKAGQDLHYKMDSFGSKCFHDIVKVDGASGSQTSIIDWSNDITKKIIPDSLIEEIKAANARNKIGTSPTVYSMKWLADEEIHIGDSAPIGNMLCCSNTELCDVTENKKTKFIGLGLTRSIRHIEFDGQGKLSYQSGDHVSVTPLNSESQCMRLIKCFAYEMEKAALNLGYHKNKPDGKIAEFLAKKSESYRCTPSLMWQMYQKFYIEYTENGKTKTFQSRHLTNNTLIEVLVRVLDFSFQNSLYAIDLIAMISTKLEKLDKEQLREKHPRLYSFLGDFELLPTRLTHEDTVIKNFNSSYPTIIDFLKKFRDLLCCPIPDMITQPLISFADVMVLIPKIRNRFYSISSSNIISPSKLSLTVGIVRAVTGKGKIEKGLCSNYLAELSEGDLIEAKVIKSTFRRPLSAAYPVVMIGAGTGIAPFMAFMEERAAEIDGYLEYADWYFFYGCRRRDEFLYRKKIKQWHASGVVNVHIAYSREEEFEKKYVQDLLQENSELIMELLMCKDTHFMFCGNAAMANSCRETIIKMLMTYGDFSKISASHLLSSMTFEGRWQYDVWGDAKNEDENVGLDQRRRTQMFRHESQKSWCLDF